MTALTDEELREGIAKIIRDKNREGDLICHRDDADGYAEAIANYLISQIIGGYVKENND